MRGTESTLKKRQPASQDVYSEIVVVTALVAKVVHSCAPRTISFAGLSPCAASFKTAKAAGNSSSPS
jgi:hypothetical protein